MAELRDRCQSGVRGSKVAQPVVDQSPQAPGIDFRMVVDQEVAQAGESLETLDEPGVEDLRSARAGTTSP